MLVENPGKAGGSQQIDGSAEDGHELGISRDMNNRNSVGERRMR